MSNNGLSTDEKVNLLFKNYMNFTSTLDSKEFFEETALANNANIFSDNIMSTLPPANPTYSQINNASELSSLLVNTGLDNINIDNTWFSDKTQRSGSSFSVDANNTIVRMEKIKLDYVTNAGAGFICKDKNGVNILQNIIPSNYAASGYSISLHYYNGSELKPVGWLATRSELAGAGFIGQSVNFGGALFDSKNGIITFYDVNGSPSAVFGSAEFYLTATKYVGPKGITTSSKINVSGDASFNSNVFTGGNLDVSGATTLNSTLNTTGDASFNSGLSIDGNLNVDSNAVIDGDLLLKGSGIINNDLHIKRHLTVDGSLSFLGEFIQRDTVIQVTEQMDLSNDGTGPALIVRQHGAQPVATFYDDESLSMLIKDGGDVSFNENIIVEKTSTIKGDASFNSNLSIDGNLNVDSNSILTGSVGIGTDSAPVKVTINSTDSIKIPVGTNAERPTATSAAEYGYIRYNTDISSYEGFGAGNAWGSLGGVKDVDQDTYISAENSAGADNDQLKFFTASTEKMMIDTNGNVGVGTASPSEKLHIANSSIATSVQPLLTLEQRTSASSTGPALNFRYIWNAANAHVDAARIAGVEGGGYAGQLAFYTKPSGTATGINNGTLTEKMRIDAAGNVGIGITNPTEKLHVIGDILVAGTGHFTGENGTDDPNINTTPGVHIGTYTNGATKYANIQLVSTDDMNWIDFTTDSDNTDREGRILYHTTNGMYFETDTTERLRIDTTGNVGIGSQSPQSKLDVNGSIRGAYNTDTTSYFGRAAIGYTGYSDIASFCHIDFNNTTSYAFAQSAVGDSIMNSHTGKQLFFRLGGADKMRLDAAGNFGIGTGSPASKLDVNGSIRGAYNTDTTSYFARAAIGLPSRGNWATFSHINKNDGQNYSMSVNNNGYLILNHSTGQSMVFSENDQAKMTLTGGNFGIGTGSPASKLDVNGSIRGAYNTDTVSYFGRAAIGFNSSHTDYASFAHLDANSNLTYAIMQHSSGRTFINSSTDLDFRVNDSEKMKLNAAGNFGIGTVPTAKLHVAGTTKITGDVSFNSGLSVDGNLNVDTNAVIDGDLLVKGSGTVDNDFHIKRHLTVDGSINFLGDFIQRDTIIQVTEQMDLSNDGTGPALIVRQHGAQPVATFYDDETMSLLIKDGGDVSFNENIIVEKTSTIKGDASFNSNLSIDGNLNVDQAATITGKFNAQNDASFNAGLSVDGNLNVDTNITVDGDASLNGILSVEGNGVFNNDVHIKRHLTVDGSVNFIGEFIQRDTVISVTEQMDLSNDGTGPALIVRQHGAQPIAKYYDDTNMIMIIDDGGDVSFNENININKTLKVGGDASFNAGLSVDGNLNVDQAATITGKFIAENDASLNKTLTVDGATALKNTLTTLGDASFNAGLSIDGNFNVDSNSILTGSVGIGTNSAPVKVTINSTDSIKIPVGTNAQRPTATGSDHYGYIRYNTDISSYEGFGAGNAWGSLGGVKDVDQDTYISAENSAGADNDQLKFFTASTEKMRIETGGNVGIGSQTPQSKLDVNGSIRGAYNTDTTSYFGRAAIGLSSRGNWATFSHINKNDGQNYSMSVNHNGYLILNHSTGQSMVFSENDQAKMTLTGGDFGIGTTTPQSKLDVNGSIRGAYNTDTTSYFGRAAVGYTGHTDIASLCHIDFNNTTSYAFAQSGTGDSIMNSHTGKELFFRLGGADKMKLDAAGNFGINTISPTAKLHVAGTTKITGDASFNSGLSIDGNLNVNTNAVIMGDSSLNGVLNVEGNGVFNNNLLAKQNATVGSDLNVGGTTLIYGNTTMERDLHVKRHLTVDGSINFLGNFIQRDTIINVTEQMDLSNDGTGPALIVRQHGAQPVATFYDDETMSMLIKDGGDVSFNENIVVEKNILTNSNLTVQGTTDLNSTLTTSGDASFNSNLSIDRNLNVDQAATITGKFIAENDASFNSNLSIDGNLNVDQAATITGKFIAENDASLNKTLTVDGATALKNTLTTLGDASFNAGLSIDGNLNVDQAATITGKFIAQDDASLNKTLTVDGATALKNTLTTTGDASFNAGLSIDGNLNVDQAATITGKFIAENDASLNKTLTVDGATALKNTLTTLGDASFNSNLSIDGNLNVDSNSILTGSVGIGTNSAPVKVTINSTDAIKIPVGTDAQRPTATGSDHYGYIRYNTEISSYEGFGAGNAWGSLGGVKDVDQDTYISAENSAGADNDQLKFFTASTEKMIIDTTGNIGIGTNNPNQLLHLYRAGGGGKLRLSSANTMMYFGTNDGTEAYMWINTDDDFKIGTNNTERMRISSAGNVGIGSQTPQSKLDVNGSIRGAYDTDTTSYFGRAAIGFNSSHSDYASFAHLDANSNLTYAIMQHSSGRTFINSSTDLDFRVNDSEKMKLNAAGNFGIGTVPTAKLHVAGTTKITGDASFNSGLSIDGNLNVDTNAVIDGDLLVKGSGTVDNDLHIKRHLTVDGSINFLGDFIQRDTIIQVTEQMDLSNDGTGPALIVRQHGAQPVATFYDDETMSMLIKDGGDVSFNENIVVEKNILTNSNLTVQGTTDLNSTLTTSGDASFNSNLSIDRNLNVDQAATITGKFIAENDASFNSNLSIDGNLNVDQAATITGKFIAENDASLNKTLTVDGATALKNTLTTLGDASFNAGLSIDGNLNVDTNATVDGQLIVKGNIINNTNTVTNTQLSYLSGVTSAIQTQINSKHDIIDSSNRLNAEFIGANGNVSNTEYGYLSNVSSDIQSQIDSKQATLTGATSQLVSNNLAASKALTSNASGKVVVSAVTDTELGYVSGVTSSIQTQIDDSMKHKIQFTVTVTTKTTNHPYHGSGSSSGYILNGQESPVVQFKSGKTYRFNQSDTTNGSHPILFYLDAGKTTQYTTGVTTSGSAGSSGAYVEIEITDNTPSKLYYQCANHGYMGNYGAVEIAVNNVTNNKIAHLNDVTSPIQSQIDSKQATLTGATSGLVSTDLTASRALTSNASGKVVVSAVTDTELGYVSGVISSIQSQLDSKQATLTGATSGLVSTDLTASRALTSNASGKVVVSAVTDTELGYVSGVTSAIQTQIDTNKDYVDTSLNNHYHTKTFIDTSLNTNYVSKDGDGTVLITGDLTVDGSINFTGDFIKTDTIIRVTEQMDLSNDGTGPALIVRQHGAQPIASFYDDASLSMVIKNGGDVSFNKSVAIGNNITIDGTTTIKGSIVNNTNTVTNDELSRLSGVTSGIQTQIDSVNTSITNLTTGSGGTTNALNVGTTAQRPDPPSKGMIRFNTDISLAEIYTASDIWSGLPTYKTGQPPLLVNVSKNQQSSSVSVSWEKFPEIYKDAFTGQSYPIYLQTFVDISYTQLNGNNNTNGWKTIRIGNGNYHTNGSATTPLTSLSFTAASGLNSSNSTGYTLTFDNKPSTANLPVFTQNDTFDLRIYGVNNSGKPPIYIYILNVGLKTTSAPSAVVVTNFENFSKTQFRMDTTFDLDSTDPSITSGITITEYDISFTLVDSKSKETVTDTDRFQDRDNYNSKNDIILNGLKPGAKYAVNLRAKNALNSSIGPYGTMYTASNFTNNGNSSMFIDTVDLNNVSHNGMEVTLNGNATINGHLHGTNSIQNRTLFSSHNTDSYISLDGTSTFYINYGKQGTTLDATSGSLVTATFNIKNTSGTTADTIQYTKTASANTASIGVGGSQYQFTSAGSYTDKGKTANYSQGFVYSSDFDCTNGNNNNAIFNTNFPASTTNYYLNYSIATQTENQNQRIDENGHTSTSRTTNNFYVDSYNSTPEVSFNEVPTITVTSSTKLFGIPSVTQVQLTSNYTISNFASFYIPYSSDRHSSVNTISKNGYSFGVNDKTDVYQNNAYTMAYSKTSNVTNNRYDANTVSDFTVTVFYLNNSGTPTVQTHTDNNKDVNDIGHIFRDVGNTYSGVTSYFFNGSDTISSAITTNNASFETTYSSNISSTLLYFNNRFVSGGYSATYDGQAISPFSDWRTSGGGYAVDGPNYSSYSNTGVGGFKWIVLDVTDKREGANIDVANFYINGSHFSTQLTNFGSTFEAYISYDGMFGSMKDSFNAAATLWYNNSNPQTNISQAKNSGLYALNTTVNASGHQINAIVNSQVSGDIYLVVGLAQNANSYFTFS